MTSIKIKERMRRLYVLYDMQEDDLTQTQLANNRSNKIDLHLD